MRIDGDWYRYAGNVFRPPDDEARLEGEQYGRAGVEQQAGYPGRLRRRVGAALYDARITTDKPPVRHTGGSDGNTSRIHEWDIRARRDQGDWYDVATVTGSHDEAELAAARHLSELTDSHNTSRRAGTGGNETTMTEKTPTTAKIHQATMIPLRNLVRHPRNVRTSDKTTDIDSLAATIHGHGLLHNLVVEELPEGEEVQRIEQTPTDETLFGVIGGGRRLEALRQLANKEHIEWTEGIPCVVPDDPDKAEELSYTENANRIALNPVDAFEAYDRFIKSGATVRDVAQRFGVTQRHVKQRLRLAGLAPEVKAAGREGKLTIGLLEAFTVTKDHDAQRNVLDRLGDNYWDPSPQYVRSQLTQQVMTSNSRIIRTIGMDAYTKAGGRVERDLFSSLTDDNGNGTFILDPDVAERVLMEQLEATALELRNEDPPWKWVEVVRDLAHDAHLGYGATGTEIPVPPEIKAKMDSLEAEEERIADEIDDISNGDGEDSQERYEQAAKRHQECHTQLSEMQRQYENQLRYTRAERSISGCIVHFDYSGIVVKMGLVKAEDSPTAEKGQLVLDPGARQPAEAVEPGEPDRASAPDTEADSRAEAAVAAPEGDTEADRAAPATKTADGPDAGTPQAWRTLTEDEKADAEDIVTFTPRPDGDQRTTTTYGGGTDVAARVDSGKLILKGHGLSGAHADRLREHRMAIVRAHADRDPQLLCDLVSYHHWSSTIVSSVHPGADAAAEKALGMSSMVRLRSDALLTQGAGNHAGRTTSPSEESRAGKALARADKLDGSLDLSWLSEPDQARRFQALRDLPPRMRKRLFTAAVCSWMKPQLSVDTSADLGLEAAIQEMDIDWAEACRPDREYWKRTPMTWTRKALEAEVSKRVAADATKGRKDEASQRLEAIFQDDKAHQPVAKVGIQGSTQRTRCTTLARMAMGTTRDDGSQQSMWVAPDDLPRSAGHPFYERLNRVLSAAGFDAFVEDLCAKFYAAMGRPSLAPGRYFRLLLVGYFEGLDSERAIAWRAADSLSVRSFLLLSAPASPPDHSTISRTRRLFSVETHDAVFTWVLQQLSDAGLVQGKTLGIDATTLEANAAMRAIVRRDTGEDYNAFLTRLAKASGIETPTAEELARFDRKRKKKMSNEEWTHPHDPDSKIAKMKDGSTHMAHKVEHAVDLGTGAVVGLTLQGAEKGDTETVVETAVTAAEQVEAVLPEGSGVAEMVGDKGYHSNETLVGLAAVGVRSYISEPDRGKRSWEDHPEARDPVYGNRRRIRGKRGRRLLRSRGELVERTFAHAYETGGMRRVHLRGHPNILKRLLVHVAGLNLGLLLRHLTGVGTPRSLQGRAFSVICGLIGRLIDLLGRLTGSWGVNWPRGAPVGSIAHHQAA